MTRMLVVAGADALLGTMLLAASMFVAYAARILRNGTSSRWTLTAGLRRAYASG